MRASAGDRVSAPAGTCVLDHVALRVADRDAVAEQLLDLLEINVIERTERLTLLGPSFSAGKITLLDAEGDAQPPASRIVSVVLAAGAGRDADAPIVLPCGLVLTFQSGRAEDEERFVAAPRHALVGLALRSDDPPIAATLLDAEYGLRADAIGSESASLTCGSGADGGFITLVRDRTTRLHASDGSERMLDHVGIRVEDAAAWRDYADHVGMEVDRWVEAPHSRAAFVLGPEGLVIEYVEQTASLGDA